jgi:hypothetical protein
MSGFRLGDVETCSIVGRIRPKFGMCATTRVSLASAPTGRLVCWPSTSAQSALTPGARRRSCGLGLAPRYRTCGALALLFVPFAGQFVGGQTA